MSLQLQWTCSVSKLELIFLCRLKGIERFYGKKNSLRFQWPCSVSKLELIFLCCLKGIEGFYGKDVTAIFSDPVQCPIWSWYFIAILVEWKDFVAKKSLKFQWPCSVFNLEVIFLCNLGRIGGFYGKDVTAVSVNLFSVQTGADIPLPPIRNRKILWQRIHCSFSDPVQCPTWSWYSFANWEE